MHPFIAEMLVKAHQDDVQRSIRPNRVSRSSRRGAVARRYHAFSSAHRHDEQY